MLGKPAVAQPVVEARGMAGAWSCCCLSSAADERHTGAGSEGAQAREDPCLVAGVCKPPTLLDPALRADAASGSDRRVNPETWGPLLSTPYQATKRGLIPEHSPSYLSAGGCWLRVWAPPQMQHPTPPFLPGSETSSKNSVWESHEEAPEEDNHRQSSGSGGHHHSGGPRRHHGDTEHLPEASGQAGCRSVMGSAHLMPKP